MGHDGQATEGNETIHDLFGAVRAQNEQGAALEVARRQRGKEIERKLVCPSEIVEYQENRLFPSERCDGFPQVHEKALARAVDAEADWRDSRRQPGNLREQRLIQGKNGTAIAEQPFGDFG